MEGGGVAATPKGVNKWNSVYHVSLYTYKFSVDSLNIFDAFVLCEDLQQFVGPLAGDGEVGLKLGNDIPQENVDACGEDAHGLLYLGRAGGDCFFRYGLGVGEGEGSIRVAEHVDGLGSTMVVFDGDFRGLPPSCLFVLGSTIHHHGGEGVAHDGV